ncbi:MAG: hypothetical protein QM690_11415 [Sphingobium sp.]
MTSEQPDTAVKGFRFALAASTTLWLVGAIGLALLYRMEGKSLRHSIQHRAGKIVDLVNVDKS